MKNTCYILLCLGAFSISTLCGADSPAKSASVEERLRETDLALTLHHYERVQMEAFEVKLKIDLLETDGEKTPEKRRKEAELLNKRASILSERVQELRLTALKLGEESTPRTALDREKAKLKELLTQYSAENPLVKRQQERIQHLEANAK